MFFQFTIHGNDAVTGASSSAIFNDMLLISLQKQIGCEKCIYCRVVLGMKKDIEIKPGFEADA